MTKSQWFVLLSTMLTSLVVEAGEVLQDPTRPSAYVPRASNENKLTSWELNAIIFSPQHKVAVINGIIVKEGDAVMDAKVVSIEPSTVHLAAPAGNITLFLVDKSVKNVSTVVHPRQGS